MRKRTRKDQLRYVTKKMKRLQETMENLKKDYLNDSGGSETDIRSPSPPPVRKPRRIQKIISSSSDDEQEEGSQIITVAEIHDPPTAEIASSVTTIDTLLGMDPKKLTSAGPPLDEDIVCRWQSYLTEGIDKVSREDFSKILFPGNCTQLAGPVLNAEVEKLLSIPERKKDTTLSSIQDKLGRGLTLLGEVISLLLSSDGLPIELKALLTPKTAQSAKIFCEVHYLLSNHRKHQIYPYMCSTIQKVAEQSNRDASLFGSDFNEKCKAAQTLEKTTIDIKLKKSAFVKKQYLQGSSNYLNSQRQAPRSKMKSQNPRYSRKSESSRKPPGRPYRQKYYQRRH